jgi:deoxyribonuclease-4
VIHVNDSKNPRGSRKDRHENIGYGTIGFDRIINLVYYSRIAHIPKILETPVDDNLIFTYRNEIMNIKNKKFVN